MIHPKHILYISLGLLCSAFAAIIGANAYFSSLTRGQVAGISQTADFPISGVILPHHNLAKPLILQAMAQLQAAESPSVIVVFSPNHFVPSSPLAVSGTVLEAYPIDTPAVAALEQAGKLEIQNELLKNEHGLYVPISYLHQTFPQAKFIPIMISPLNYQADQVNALAAALINQVPAQTLFVTSTDFAHNLQSQAALTHNETSIGLIKNFNFPEIIKLNDDYLDAPVAVALFLKIMQLRNTTTWELWQSSHGALLTNQPSMQGTSYVIGVFR